MSKNTNINQKLDNISATASPKYRENSDVGADGKKPMKMEKSGAIKKTNNTDKFGDGAKSLVVMEKSGGGPFDWPPVYDRNNIENNAPSFGARAKSSATGKGNDSINRAIRNDSAGNVKPTFGYDPMNPFFPPKTDGVSKSSGLAPPVGKDDKVDPNFKHVLGDIEKLLLDESKPDDYNSTNKNYREMYKKADIIEDGAKSLLLLAEEQAMREKNAKVDDSHDDPFYNIDRFFDFAAYKRDALGIQSGCYSHFRSSPNWFGKITTANAGAVVNGILAGKDNQQAKAAEVNGIFAGEDNKEAKAAEAGECCDAKRDKSLGEEEPPKFVGIPKKDAGKLMPSNPKLDD